MDDYSSWHQKKKAQQRDKSAESKARMRGMMRKVQGALHPLTADGMATASDLAPVPFRLLLVDLTLEGLTVFASAAIPPGQRIEVRSELPDWYVLQADVLWCNLANRSPRLIGGQGSFAYRVGIQWRFGSDEEQEQLKRVFASFKIAHE